MMTANTRNFLRAAITEYAEGEGLELRENYSGRGMFGRRCIGIVTGDIPGTLAGIGSYITEMLEDDIESGNLGEGDAYEIEQGLTAGCRSDSMGFDSIIYWPNIPAEEGAAKESA